MVQERKVTKQESVVLLKGVPARRDHKQPYASEVEDYVSASVETPQEDPRRKSSEATHERALSKQR